MELRVFVILFGILFVGLLGVYTLVIKVMRDTNEQLGKIYATVNGHMKDTAVHIDPEHPMVTAAVCLEVQKRNEVYFKTLTDGQKRIGGNVDRLVDKLL